MDFEDFLSQNLRLIKKKLTVEYINKEDDDTFLYYVLMKVKDLSLSKLKYIFKFCIRNLPFVLLDKGTFDYFVNYCSSPDTVFIYYSNKNLYCVYGIIYILNYFKYNFPEMSRKTNNFILPLLMEIQN